jgi:Fe2+ or Zn2+ uptake regulation protein
MDSSEEARIPRLLRQAGLRVTPQRILLLEIIAGSEGHLDADEIYRRVRGLSPRLSLSTVYRTLSLLRDEGLVRELHFDEDHHHYELCDDAAGKHYHLYCLGCGTIVEFEGSLVTELEQSLAQTHDFAIVGSTVDVAGYCAQCRSQRDAQGNIP